jgi:hypothetical protein
MTPSPDECPSPWLIGIGTWSQSPNREVERGIVPIENATKAPECGNRSLRQGVYSLRTGCTPAINIPFSTANRETIDSPKTEMM